MNGFLSRLLFLFRPPPAIQVATLCLRGSGAGTEILLIRSLDAGNWILPKGWPMKGKTLAEAAEIEAWEEAGLRGTVDPVAIGTFASRKTVRGGINLPSVVHVFVMQVLSEAEDYPEAAFRKRKWRTAANSVARLSPPELQDIVTAYLDGAPGPRGGVVMPAKTL